MPVEVDMIYVKCDYTIKADTEFLLDAEKINLSEFSERTGVSRTTLDSILKKGMAGEDVCEKIYSYAYRNNYRINSVKEELRKEQYNTVLFHGSRNGLTEVSSFGSRDNCDFGKGFYLGETYNQALSFVCEKEKSSVYSFTCSLDGLNIARFECNLDWMLAICYYRGKLNEYKSCPGIASVLEKIKNADVIVAPIADNKMFYVMTQFTDGEINADVALHSLSASKLGLQYVLKTEKAVNSLVPIERYYLSAPERDECEKKLYERSFEIDTKLKLAKREYKSGLYIEELLK